jgi:hypothetical protein
MSDDEDCDLVYDLLQEAESIGDNYKEVSANLSHDGKNDK